MVLMLSLCIGLFFMMDSMTQKAYLGIFSIIITIVILHTLSRSSWLAALSVVPFFIIFLQGKKRITAVLITMVAALIFVFFPPDSVKRRISNTFVNKKVSWQQQSILGRPVDQSTSMRLSDWKTGLRDWLQNHFVFSYIRIARQ